MSILIWRILKILLVVVICGASAYYSLRTRVEKEIGPWEQWIGDDSTRDETDTRKPRNLHARFWTGVPRGGDGDMVRIDRHGYSLGYSRYGGRALWAAVFLPGGKVSQEARRDRGIWKNDPEIAKWPRQDKSNEDALQIVPAWLMDSFYGYSGDTWYRTNRAFSDKADGEVWEDHLKLVADYAAVYDGVIAFFGPYEDQAGGGRGFFSIVLRKGSSGPEVLAFLLERQGGKMTARTSSVEGVEKATGLRFFADLPPEWRSYLRKKPAVSPWAH